jgi:exodeoxyribonuclease X
MTAIIFDTEATGLDQPHVIEAAWLRVPDPNNLVPTETFLQRYNPGKPIALGALATHHIMDEDLAACPPHTEFRLPDGIDYLVGYNVDYDWRVIGEPQIRRICVMALSRSLFPGLDSYSQSAVLYHLERHRARELLKNAHSAMQDVENCRIILERILRLVFEDLFPSVRSEGREYGLHGDLTWEEVWRRSELARIPTVMSFGKHKGIAIKDIPADYKRWLLGQPDVDPYLAKALREVAA